MEKHRKRWRVHLAKPLELRVDQSPKGGTGARRSGGVEHGSVFEGALGNSEV
jgi:hypothetical protein